MYKSKAEKRNINEKMSAVLIPMMNYCDEDTKYCISRTLEILSDTKIEDISED